MGHTPMDAMPTWLSSGGVDVLERLALVFLSFSCFICFSMGNAPIIHFVRRHLVG